MIIENATILVPSHPTDPRFPGDVLVDSVVVSPNESNDQTTVIDPTPDWYQPIKIPDGKEIRLPAHYDKDSPRDVRTYQCLSVYRFMKNKDKIIDFIAEPFIAAADKTETLVVVLNELATQLGARLGFA